MVKEEFSPRTIKGISPACGGVRYGGLAKWEGRGLQNLYSPVQIRKPPF